jgi:cytochrome c oxidase subunit II
MVVLMRRVTRRIPRALALGGVASLLVVSLGAQPTEAPAPRVVRIAAERFAFTPSQVTVTPGTTIEFVLTSEDTGHGFRIVGQSVDLTIPKRGRGEASVRFTPPAAGVYVFECSRMCGAGHSFMRGSIVVKAASGQEPR